MGSIHVTHLGKAYRQYPNRWSRLAEWLDPRGKAHHALKWVLKDVNFHVAPGESVGIIGVNGAGKSTLLKLITGTANPTEGVIEKAGRITAMLELGMGFHPDFTGRQNLFMAGQLIGLSPAEITRLMPEIEEFAEIGDYIDQPVRVYSSGMYVRLAFSLATAVRPDILVVDEALSVGDAYFQHKCFERIRDYSKAGTSLLFVSHDGGAIKNLCQRAILLHQGGVAFSGAPEDVLDYYNALLADAQASYVGSLNAAGAEQVEPRPDGMRSGDGKLRIASVALSHAGKPAAIFTAGREMSIEVRMKVHEPVADACVGIAIKDRFGNNLIGTNTAMLKRSISATEVGAEISVGFRLPALNIGAGHYSLAVALHDPRSHVVGNHDWWDRAAMLEVVQPPSDAVTGLCYMPIECYMEDASPVLPSGPPRP